ncbi:MAG: ribosome biogenesis GTPase YlqF [Firmicutes bacterium]|nr:ribosome biogenesis GTPase YlqF [Bacillota bacterium]
MTEKQAEYKQTENNHTDQKPLIQWYPGHMAKAKRRIDQDMDIVDIIIEVADARAPLSSINPDIRAYAKRKGHVLLFNKEDLADPQQTKLWLKEYRHQGLIPVAINSLHKQGLRYLSAAVEEAAEPLYARLKARGRLPRAVRAMVIGVPNCGKSTVINALAPTAAAKTGNMPGVTKGRQWVKTNIGLELLDTPGILWPRFATYDTAFKLAVLGCISDLVYPVYQVAVDLTLWLAEHAPDAVRERYRLIELPKTAEEILWAIGAKRGLLGAGGIVRTEDTALLLMQEFRGGKLGRHTLDKFRA